MGVARSIVCKANWEMRPPDLGEESVMTAAEAQSMSAALATYAQTMAHRERLTLVAAVRER